MHTRSAHQLVQEAHNTATYFGFSPIETVCGKRPKTVRTRATDRKLDALSGTLTDGACVYFEHAGSSGTPQLIYAIREAPRSGDLTVSFHVIGVPKSIAEALLIHVLRSLTTDLGYTEQTVRINSIGDTDSSARYNRELTAYLRKRLEHMPTEARERMKDDTFAALSYLIGEQHELCERCPSPLEYLSDSSRKHFRDIIEYLDMTGTPYEIDPRLIGNPLCYSDALFAIDVRDNEGTTPFTIHGGRIDTFIKHIFKQDVPGASAVLTFTGKKAPARIARPKRAANPSVYVVQLGFGPKIRTLMLLEELKRAAIPAYQSVVSDSLSEQLRRAESLKVPYSLIVGQKEFVEDSVILRDMRSSSQQNIAATSLIPKLRRVLKQV